MKKYIFFNRNGECCEKEADPSRSETLPFAREEITDVFLNCTELFLGRTVIPHLTHDPLNTIGGWRSKHVMPADNSQESKKLQKLFDCIAVRYREKLTFDFALSMMGMSKSRFCAFFRKRTGMTYIEYINKERIKKAIPLLIETNLTVEAVGFDCGFDSPPSFYKYFKAHYGMSPARFRAEKRL